MWSRRSEGNYHNTIRNEHCEYVATIEQDKQSRAKAELFDMSNFRLSSVRMGGHDSTPVGMVVACCSGQTLSVVGGYEARSA